VEIRDAAHLQGMGASETAEQLKKELKDLKIQVAAIGLAGENRVFMASIEHHNSSASRGVGVIMGDKRLKAIAVRGTKDINVQLHKNFEDYAHKIDGEEFWFARDLLGLLGYAKWENFAKVIDKAKIACQTAGHNVSDHFPDVRKMIQLGKGAEREVEDIALIELKSVENIHPVHSKQLLTYLRLMDLPLGLLINFGAPLMKEGLHRVVNKHTNFASSRLRVHQDIFQGIYWDW